MSKQFSIPIQVASRPAESIEALAIRAHQCHVQGHLAEAVVAYRQLLERDPSQASCHYNLGLALHALQRLDEAEVAFRAAIEWQADFALAHHNLGFLRSLKGDLSAAIASYQRSLELDSNQPLALANLSAALIQRGDLDDAAEIADRLLELKGGQLSENETLGILGPTLYRFGSSIEAISLQHRGFARWLNIEPGRPAFEHVRDPLRRLKLGILSGDLRAHAVSFCALPVFTALDREQFELHAFSNAPADDAFRERWKQLAKGWYDVQSWSDDQLADCIRVNQIDIVIDLAGHTGAGRVATLVRRVAPIQVSWLGYPFPTTATAVDYHLADRWLAPDEVLAKYDTPILRLPTLAMCFEPFVDSPSVVEPPCVRRGTITFAAFHRPAKINTIVLETWARLMHRVPHSQLLLKYVGFDDPETAARFRRRFLRLGIDPTRLRFEGHSPILEMLQRYNEVDLTLDPFPFNGGVTTFLSVWMGVPVVTWPGETIASRQSLAVLHQLGITQTIAESRDAYIAIAARLCENPGELRALRRDLRHRFLASGLADGQRIAPHLERQLRELWRNWCGVSPSPASCKTV